MLMIEFLSFLPPEFLFLLNILPKGMQVRVNSCCIKLVPWGGGKSTQPRVRHFESSPRDN